MIVQFAEYAARKKSQCPENKDIKQIPISNQIIELSTRQEFAAYERAKARVQEAAAKLEW